MSPSVLLGKLWQTGEVTKYWKTENKTPSVKRGKKKEEPRRFQAVQFHLCALQDHGTGAPGNCAKARRK